jgi:hypothetical protein
MNLICLGSLGEYLPSALSISFEIKDRGNKSPTGSTLILYLVSKRLDPPPPYP